MVKASARGLEPAMDRHCRQTRPALAILSARELCSAHEARANAKEWEFVQKRANIASALEKVTVMGPGNAQGLVPALEERYARVFPLCRMMGDVNVLFCGN